MSKLEEIKQRYCTTHESIGDPHVCFEGDFLALCEEQDRDLREAVELLRSSMPHFRGTALSLEEDIDDFLARHEGDSHE